MRDYSTAVDGPLVLNVPGQPVPWSRPRAVLVGDYIRFFTSNQVRNYTRMVTTQIRAAIGIGKAQGIRFPLDCAVSVDLLFTLERPKSASGAYRHFPFKKPDIDNLAKGVLDSMTDGGFFTDDTRVVDLRARKRWGDPGVLITVTEIDQDE